MLAGLLHFGVVTLIVGFAFFFGFKRLSNAKRGEPVEFETDELLGTGILAMAVTFGISWLIINDKGVKND